MKNNIQKNNDLTVVANLNKKAIPQRLAKPLTEILIAILASCFLAIMSQLSIFIPFTPVPLTLQTLALFLLGGFLGSRRALLSVIAYLAQGHCGLPVFAGGISNPLWFIDIKAGFLVSFIAAVFVIGKMLEKQVRPHFLYILLALSVGQLVIFFIGTSWMSLYVGLSKALLFGVFPFIKGAILKILAAALIIKGYSLIKKTTPLQA